MSENVVGLRGGTVEVAADQALVDAMKACVQKLRAEGAEPTAALWVVMSDDGQFRFGWNSERSSLPASAIVGIGVAAIMKVGQDGCEH